MKMGKSSESECEYRCERTNLDEKTVESGQEREQARANQAERIAQQFQRRASERASELARLWPESDEQPCILATELRAELRKPSALMDRLELDALTRWGARRGGGVSPNAAWRVFRASTAQQSLSRNAGRS